MVGAIMGFSQPSLTAELSLKNFSMYEYRDALALAEFQRIESTLIPDLLPWWEVVKKGLLGVQGVELSSWRRQARINSI
jgi:hypothetical protein